MRGFFRRRLFSSFHRSPIQRQVGKIPVRSTVLSATILPSFVLLANQGGLGASALDAKGDRAETIAWLFWALLAISVVVFIVMVGAFLIGAARRTSRDTRNDKSDGTRVISIFGIIIPGAIVLAVFGVTLWVLADMSTSADAADTTIEVVGHQWWWEVKYSDHDFTTANEIHIPVGKTVNIQLTSQDVIHSFWIPQLADKLDMLPGHTNVLPLKANEAGTYYGQCAEYCGAQHANMAIRVIAESEDDYASWISSQQQVAAQPESGEIERGQQVYFNAACMYCHTIAGTSSSGKIGPDLTHLASRDYIGAGVLENNPGNLRGWILNNQTIKPNNQMPNFYLSPEDMDALIAYLESLE